MGNWFPNTKQSECIIHGYEMYHPFTFPVPICDTVLIGSPRRNSTSFDKAISIACGNPMLRKSPHVLQEKSKQFSTTLRKYS